MKQLRKSNLFNSFRSFVPCRVPRGTYIMYHDKNHIATLLFKKVFRNIFASRSIKIYMKKLFTKIAQSLVALGLKAVRKI